MKHMRLFALPKALGKSYHLRKRFSRTLHILGPGLVTGAADDDPSGIATYSQAGAVYGYKLLWMIPLMYPLLLSVQGSCSRIGAVTGKGLAAIIKEHYSKKMLYLAVGLVVVANVVNIGADFGALASTFQLFFPSAPFLGLVFFFAVLILALEIFVPYKRYAKILKWLAIVLFAYPITAILAGQDWGHIFQAAFNPAAMSYDFAAIMMIVGLFGTTISPYLFFWDTSEVVEDEIAHKRIGLKHLHMPRLNTHFLRDIWLDNVVGMTLATLTAWFIMLTCASVLHNHNITEIKTAADAAEALKPLVSGFPYAGFLSEAIFSIGILGTGLLAIPVLAGSCSYAITEVFNWKEGLGRTFKKAKAFYVVIILATLAGATLNFVGIKPFEALVWAAVVNGIAAVPLLVMIARIGRNKAIMGEYTIGKGGQAGTWIAFGVMALSSIAMLIGFILH